MKKIFGAFLAAIMCVSLSVPVLADFQGETTPNLLSEFKEIAQESDYSDETLIPYIGELVNRSSEFSDDELISIISNNTETPNYRRGIRVYGPISGDAWDISLNDAYAQDIHNGVAAITPKSQAENYMDQVDLS